MKTNQVAVESLLILITKSVCTSCAVLNNSAILISFVFSYCVELLFIFIRFQAKLTYMYVIRWKIKNMLLYIPRVGHIMFYKHIF